MIEPGTQLEGRYLIEECIGEGGMGAVYRAVDQKFGTRVAVKGAFFGRAELTEAFEREARLLNGLHHPILPHVSDHFTENGGHFLVMQYIEGEDLSAVLKRDGAFPIHDVVRWTLDLLDGLDYLHSQDPPILHRDIKPNNLKLTSRGNVVLLDFGMAKEASGNTLGMRSVFGYSRRYSPLEQIEGTGTDVRSDIFSLGATVFHLLTGTPPVDVLARASAIVAGRPDPLEPATAVNEDVPEALSAILSSALSLNPDMRFESVRAMRNAWEAAIGRNANDAAVVKMGEGDPDTSVAAFPALQAFEAENARDAAPASGPSAGPAMIHLGTIDIEEDLPEMPIPDEKARVDAAETAKVIASLQASANTSYLRIKKPARWGATVWLPVVLVSAAMLAYAILRVGSNAEVAHEIPAATVETDEQGGTESRLVEGTSGVSLPADDEIGSTEADELMPSLDNEVEEEELSVLLKRPIIVRRSDDRERVAVPRKSEPKRIERASTDRPQRVRNGRDGLAIRPRIVPRPRGRRPAYTIESVMSGPRRSRPWWDEDRWEAEQRRRRRARRIWGYYPPF